MSVQRIMLDRFAAVYGQPETPNPKLYIAEWVRSFHKACPEALSVTVDRIIDERKYRTWPTIGDVRIELEYVCEKRQAHRAMKALPPPQPKAPTAEERARMDDLVSGFLKKSRAIALAPRDGAPPRIRPTHIEPQSPAASPELRKRLAA